MNTAKRVSILQLDKPICFRCKTFSNSLTKVSRDRLSRALGGREELPRKEHGRVPEGRKASGTRVDKELRGIGWVTGSTWRLGRWFSTKRKLLPVTQELGGSWATCSGPCVRATVSSESVCPRACLSLSAVWLGARSLQPGAANGNYLASLPCPPPPAVKGRPLLPSSSSL